MYCLKIRECARVLFLLCLKAQSNLFYYTLFLIYLEEEKKAFFFQQILNYHYEYLEQFTKTGPKHINNI